MTNDEMQMVASLVAQQMTPHFVEISSQISRVETKQEEHDKMHQVYLEQRHLTCPAAQQIEVNTRDIATLSNVTTSLDKRVKKIETAENRDEIVNTERMRPVKWLATNLDKVMWAIVIAVALTWIIDK